MIWLLSRCHACGTLTACPFGAVKAATVTSFISDTIDSGIIEIKGCCCCVSAAGLQPLLQDWKWQHLHRWVMNIPVLAVTASSAPDGTTCWAHACMCQGDFACHRSSRGWTLLLDVSRPYLVRLCMSTAASSMACESHAMGTPL